MLVADDNADMREYLTRLLRAAGYQVDAVIDGQAGPGRDSRQRPRPGHQRRDDAAAGRPALVAALRADPRTAAVPVLLLSARAGQEASIEGLQAGADDYLVKPFAAAELLARVRANVELARLRNHHARWRTALVDSLQEAFFVCDEHGAVIEINSAFTDILGYGPEGLPYAPVIPWWPDADTDPEAHRQVADAFAVLDETHGSYTIPVTHRDGHRLWVTVTFNHAEDPDTGRRVIVGTFRDVTAEHYAVQRESALAALNQQLSQADTLDDAVRAAAAELRSLWQARRVLAATWPGETSDRCTATDLGRRTGELGRPAVRHQQHDQVAARRRPAHSGHRRAMARRASRCSTRGVCSCWIELAEQRPFTAEDQTLLAVLAGRLGQGLQRVHQLDQQRETALALQHAILGPAQLPSGFAVRYQPATRPLQVGGDWYDIVDLDDGRIALIVGDCVGHGLAAATVMGQLRSACRALLLEQPSPSEALTALDRFAARLPGARCTTAFCAVLTPETGELVYSSAGHPPPIMVHADGTTRLLDGPAPPAWVVLRSGSARAPRDVAPPRHAAALHRRSGRTPARSSGHRHRPGRRPRAGGPDSGLDDLARPGDAAAGAQRRLPGRRRAAALPAARPAGARLPRRRQLARRTRAALARLAGPARSRRRPDRRSVLIAAGEAVANAIEHGHRHHAEGTISLRATALADRLQVTVIDTGSWKPPVAANIAGAVSR